MGKVFYSAVVLDDKSRTEIIQKFSYLIPDGWEVIAHHMTINLGEIKPELEKYLGKNILLNVIKIGRSEKAIAFEVNGFLSMNKIPHITLAVNREAGGKPFDSNKIVDWEDIDSFIVNGTVEEVRYTKN